MPKAKSNLYICIMKQYIFSLIIVCLFTSCLGKLETTNPTDIITVGQKLPNFEVVLSNGTTLTSGMLQGKPAIIVFFNTGCRDCQRELPLIQQLYEEDATHAANFLCISRNEGNASIEAYWERNGLTLPYSAQEDKTVYNLFATSSIPRVYIADSSGTVRYAYVEKVDLKTLREALMELK